MLIYWLCRALFLTKRVWFSPRFPQFTVCFWRWVNPMLKPLFSLLCECLCDKGKININAKSCLNFEKLYDCCVNGWVWFFIFYFFCSGALKGPSRLGNLYRIWLQSIYHLQKLNHLFKSYGIFFFIHSNLSDLKLQYSFCRWLRNKSQQWHGYLIFCITLMQKKKNMKQ